MPVNKKEKILVTGGAGFIASHVVDAYIDKGHQVAIIDNMAHGFKRNLNPRAKFYKADIRNLSAVRKIIRAVRPNIINHHAAIAEVAKSVVDPIPTLDVNVQGTVNLLLAGSEVGIKKFIFASTGGAIYGPAKTYPISETAPAEPESPYGLSKQLAEECIRFYARAHGFNYTIFRYPNVYGPRQDPKGEAGVVAIVSELLTHGKRPILFGHGRPTRDYVYVLDVAHANVLALHKGNGATLNLGLGKEISTQQVYDAIAAHFPQAAKPIYKPLRAGEVERSSLHAAKARHVLGWKPRYTFNQGISDYIKHI